MASVLVFNVLSRLQCSGFRLPSCNGMHMDQIPPPQSPRGWSRLDSCDPVNWLPLNTSQLMGCTWKSHPPDICSKPQTLVVYPLFMAPNRCLCSITFTSAKLGVAQSSGRGRISTEPPSRSLQKEEYFIVLSMKWLRSSQSSGFGWKAITEYCSGCLEMLGLFSVSLNANTGVNGVNLQTAKTD